MYLDNDSVTNVHINGDILQPGVLFVLPAASIWDHLFAFVVSATFLKNLSLHLLYIK